MAGLNERALKKIMYVSFGAAGCLLFLILVIGRFSDDSDPYDAFERAGLHLDPEARERGIRTREDLAGATETTTTSVEPFLTGPAHMRSEALNNRDPNLRLHMLRSLLDLGWDPETVEVARQLASDPDPEIRAAALEGLGRLGDVQSIRILTNALGEDDPAISGAARSGLVTMGSTHDISNALRQAVRVGTEDEAVDAVSIAGEIKSEGGRADIVLRDGLRSRYPRAVSAVLGILRTLPERERDRYRGGVASAMTSGPEESRTAAANIYNQYWGEDG